MATLFTLNMAWPTAMLTFNQVAKKKIINKLGCLKQVHAFVSCPVESAPWPHVVRYVGWRDGTRDVFSLCLRSPFSYLSSTHMNGGPGSIQTRTDAIANSEQLLLRVGMWFENKLAVPICSAECFLGAQTSSSVGREEMKSGPFILLLFKGQNSHSISFRWHPHFHLLQ